MAASTRQSRARPGAPAHVFSIDGIRVAHFGDFGQADLRAEQEEAIDLAPAVERLDGPAFDTDQLSSGDPLVVLPAAP